MLDIPSLDTALAAGRDWDKMCERNLTQRKSTLDYIKRCLVSCTLCSTYVIYFICSPIHKSYHHLEMFSCATLTLWFLMF